MLNKRKNLRDVYSQDFKSTGHADPEKMEELFKIRNRNRAKDRLVARILTVILTVILFLAIVGMTYFFTS